MIINHTSQVKGIPVICKPNFVLMLINIYNPLLLPSFFSKKEVMGGVKR
jgi:hypothetical protein